MPASSNEHASEQLPPDPAGDGAAEPRTETIARLFREHNEALTRFLAARLRSTQEAQEVAQEAYVRMLDLDNPGAVSFMRAFLYRTAANLAVDRIRSRERRAALDEARMAHEHRETLTPERMIGSRQEVEIVERLLSELPPACRRAFLLNRVEGLSPEEIGQQMGVAARTVRHYILQALLYCRAGLDASSKDGNHV
jgi:RNA polymerase sigma factor (sigma-70 family)